MWTRCTVFRITRLSSPPPPSNIFLSLFTFFQLSSAHVYLRLPKSIPSWEAIPEALLQDCAQLVKANSIEGVSMSELLGRSQSNAAVLTCERVGSLRRRHERSLLISGMTNSLLLRQQEKEPNHHLHAMVQYQGQLPQPSLLLAHSQMTHFPNTPVADAHNTESGRHGHRCSLLSQRSAGTCQVTGLTSSSPLPPLILFSLLPSHFSHPSPNPTHPISHQVKRVYVKDRENAIVNRLNKTKREIDVDHEMVRQEREREQGREKKAKATELVSGARPAFQQRRLHPDLVVAVADLPPFVLPPSPCCLYTVFTRNSEMQNWQKRAPVKPTTKRATILPVSGPFIAPRSHSLLLLNDAPPHPRAQSSPKKRSKKPDWKKSAKRVGKQESAKSGWPLVVVLLRRVRKARKGKRKGIRMVGWKVMILSCRIGPQSGGIN